MTNLDDQLKNLPETPFPADLHQRIMRTIYYRKLRTPLFVIGLALLGNAILIGVRIFTHIIDLDGISILAAAWDGFEWSSFFFANLWGTLWTILPLGALVSFLINISIVGYVFFLCYKTRDIYKGRLYNA